MKINDVLSGCCIGGFGVAVFMYARTFPPMLGQNVGPNLFPQLIAVGLMVCAIFLVLRGLKTRGAEPWVTLPGWVRQRRITLGFLLVPLVLLFYVGVSESLGFIPTAFLLLIALFIVFEVRLRTALIVAVLGTLVMHTMFYKILRVPLPWGVLEAFAW